MLPAFAADKSLLVMPNPIHRFVCAMLMLLALAAGAADHDKIMPPLAPGSFPVACSNLAHDEDAMNQIGGLPAEFWEGVPQDGQPRYISQILAEPQTAIQFNLRIPDDHELYTQFANDTLPFVTLVCYPTSLANPRPDYRLPDGQSIPRMERPGDLPILPDSGAAYPLIVYSHGIGGSPVSDNYLGTILQLASHGYMVMAVFHGDARIVRISIDDLSDVAYLIRNFDRYVELQALRPLALRAAVDELLARPGYRDRIDRQKIGAFGASLGAESVLLSMGAWLTTNIWLDSRPVAQDARIKAAAAYGPFSGQRLLPAFGDDQNGAQYVTRPFLAIGGTADTIAPLYMTEQAMNRMQGSHALVALTDIEHRYLPEYADDIFSWVVTFLDAYVKDDRQALARFTQTQAIAGGLDDYLRIATVSPQTGYWWNPSEGGRGFLVEERGGNAFIGTFLYDLGGRATWYAAGGPTTNSGSQFAGTLDGYFGGQTLTGPWRAPTAAIGGGGNISLSFSDSRHGTLTWAGGTIPIERFEISPGGLAAPIQANQPEAGIWWNPSEPGRGFSIEVQGNSLFLGGYMYDAGGDTLWYASVGAMADSANYQGSWQQYANGQTMTGPYNAPVVIDSAVGQVALRFLSTTNGVLTLPDGRQIPIERFRF